MSKFMNFENHERENLKTEGMNEEGYPTDVEGVYADDQAQVGMDVFPVFDVDASTFANAKNERKRVQAPADSKLQEYMSKSIYNRPFYIRHIDEDGNSQMKCIK